MNLNPSLDRDLARLAVAGTSAFVVAAAVTGFATHGYHARSETVSALAPSPRCAR